jgi:predicted NUDIX family NTP pyrophosphohydrolase
MPKHSAGILVYRQQDENTQVFLVHPGGPFWAKKDKAAWSIPKGEFDPDSEDAPGAARREFQEETGISIEGDIQQLTTLKTSGGKIIHAFCIQENLDPDEIHSNTFEMEWPPKPGKKQEFPEVDKAAWFDLDTARSKLHKGQTPLIDALMEKRAKGD